jgi:beta-glucosidase
MRAMSEYKQNSSKTNVHDSKLFPKEFYWGASTASHQVEGGTINQWSEWELAHAKELAKTAKKRLSKSVPYFKDIKSEAEDPNNYVSGQGVDHYKLYKKDFEIAKSLNLNAFRFGIEWSRIEPQPGVWDIAEIEHYRDYILELKAKGLEPFLNIWHWTMPTWFVEKGGFEKRKNLVFWQRLVRKITEEYGEDINYIITLNEPNVYATFGYITKEWVPEQRSPAKFMAVYYNLVIAHRQAYHIIKAKNPHIHVGVASQLANIQAKRPHNVIDEVVTSWMRYAWNWWFINRISKTQDFVGFNYYFTDYYHGFRRDNPRAPLNDLGWYMEPEGLYPLLVRVWAHYKKPIIITENGLADETDEHRKWWIEESIVAMERALSEGIDIRGYFHWSLLDNFEWKYGWWPKFGLVHVDRKHNMKRTIRSSALWFATVISKIQKTQK